MKAYLLYNLGSANQRVVEALSERLEQEQVDVELLDADSPRGIQMAESHDVMGRPALLLMRDDGTPVQVWQGEEGLPTVSDVSYLAHQ
jgi:hypothetical protein